VDALFDRMLQAPQRSAVSRRVELDRRLAANGFDPQQHERVRADLRAGRIGLAQNRLHPATTIENGQAEDVIDARGPDAQA
jgi:hypothetical protein